MQGVPVIRILVFGGLHWGPPIQGNYHVFSRSKSVLVGWKIAGRSFRDCIYMWVSEDFGDRGTWNTNLRRAI